MTRFDQIEHACLTDVGVRRSHNQDNYAIQLAGDEEGWKLRGHLFQVLEVNLHRKYVGRCLVVDHLITNGFGAFPAVSIQTLLVCRYSRIASIPFSRPIPDLL